MPNHKRLTLLAVTSAVVLGLLTTTPLAVAASEKVLHTFCSVNGCLDGIQPNSVILDAAGNLYGTTSGGGADHWGTVFELIPNNGMWTFSVLYSFCSASNCADGSYPVGIAFDADGNLYGTTFSGGAYDAGTVFELIPNNGTWTEKVLHNFTSGDDGSGPEAGVILDSSGNIYGTTVYGGAYHGGMVFELIPNNGTWTEKALHWFKRNGKGGSVPLTGLTLDKSGNVYGTTVDGGIYGHGTVFELTPAKGYWEEKVLHSFNMNSKGGYAPSASVIFDNFGNLYGTNGGGGAYNGGTAFELLPNNNKWTLKVLIAFKQIRRGPVGPVGLALSKSGNLYGATVHGGAHAEGSVFELIPNNDGKWSERLLYSFEQGAGAWPDSTLLFDASGNLYGTTELGGDQGDGTVFELTP
jgi:uncharacterized repeat protein (TIGR03803 family)